MRSSVHIAASTSETSEEQIQFKLWPGHDPNIEAYKAVVDGRKFYQACEAATFSSSNFASQKENGAQSTAIVRFGPDVLTIFRRTNNRLFAWMAEADLESPRCIETTCEFGIDASLLRRIGSVFKEAEISMVYYPKENTLALGEMGSKLSVCVTVFGLTNMDASSFGLPPEGAGNVANLPQYELLDALKIASISRPRDRGDKVSAHCDVVIQQGVIANHNRRSFTLGSFDTGGSAPLTLQAEYLPLIRHVVQKMHGYVTLSCHGGRVILESASCSCAWPRQISSISPLMIAKSDMPMTKLGFFNSRQLLKTLFRCSIVSKEFSLSVQEKGGSKDLVFDARSGSGVCQTRYGLNEVAANIPQYLRSSMPITFRISEMSDFIALAGDCEIELSVTEGIIRLATVQPSVRTLFFGRSANDKFSGERYTAA